MKRARRSHSYLVVGILLSSAFAAILVPGCSSDRFNPTGSSLPADVSQDSLLIPLSIVGTLDETRVDMPLLDPPQGKPIDLRQFLYFGTLATADWKATPFVQYDFSGADQSVIDSLRTFPERILRIQMSFRLGNEDSKAGSAFDFQLYELNADLDPSMAEGSATDYLGQDMGQHTAERGQTLTLDLLEGQSPDEALAIKNIFLDWWAAGTHPGIAMVDLQADSSLVGLASRDFESSNSYLLAKQVPGEGLGEIFISPRITMEYQEGSGGFQEFITVESMADLTVFDRSVEHTELALGGHVISRTWMDFDLALLPRAATINSADLVLSFDRSRLAVTGFPGQQIPFPPGTTDDELIERATGDRTFENSTLSPIVVTTVLFESSREEAEALTTNNADQVLDALRNFRPDVITSGTYPLDDELRINITAFVQRVVNGIFGNNPPGLLLAITDQELQFFEAVFFDSSAADSLRPRLDLLYTPPADFVD